MNKLLLIFLITSLFANPNTPEKYNPFIGNNNPNGKTGMISFQFPKTTNTLLTDITSGDKIGDSKTTYFTVTAPITDFFTVHFTSMSKKDYYYSTSYSDNSITTDELTVYFHLPLYRILEKY